MAKTSLQRVMQIGTILGFVQVATQKWSSASVNQTLPSHSKQRREREREPLCTAFTRCHPTLFAIARSRSASMSFPPAITTSTPFLSQPSHWLWLAVSSLFTGSLVFAHVPLPMEPLCSPVSNSHMLLSQCHLVQHGIKKTQTRKKKWIGKEPLSSG
jgi:hypothetical protein